jgi:hypothetical protein
MKPVIFFTSLMVLMLINLQKLNNSNNSPAVGFSNNEIIIPIENKAILNRYECNEADPLVSETEPGTSQLISSPALETSLSGKYVTNMLIIL